MRGVWRIGTFVHWCWECKVVAGTMENNMEVTQKIKKEPPYDTAIPSFGFTHKN